MGDTAAEAAMRAFLAPWQPDQSNTSANMMLSDFERQCDAMIELRPSVISSIMGLYPDRFVRRMKDAGIGWFATATTVAEAKPLKHTSAAGAR